jgi:hypothetical protein
MGQLTVAFIFLWPLRLHSTSDPSHGIWPLPLHEKYTCNWQWWIYTSAACLAFPIRHQDTNLRLDGKLTAFLLQTLLLPRWMMMMIIIIIIIIIVVVIILIWFIPVMSVKY